jgi:hypothetical protein
MNSQYPPVKHLMADTTFGRLFLVLCCLGAASCSSRQQSPEREYVAPWTVRDDPPISIAQLADRLEVLHKHRQSPQLLLRDATHECRRAMQNLPWAAIEPQLRQLNLTCVTNREDSYFEYLLVPDIWTTSDGAKHDLLVSFSVARSPAAKSMGGVKMDHVMLPHAVLRCDAPRRYADVMEQDVYADFPALDQSLRSPKVVEASQDLPILASVEASYDWGIYLSSEGLEQEFHLHPELTDSAVEARRGNSFTVSIPSGLDPLLDERGEKYDPRHISQDTLGEPWMRGGSGWERQ